MKTTMAEAFCKLCRPDRYAHQTLNGYTGAATNEGSTCQTMGCMNWRWQTEADSIPTVFKRTDHPNKSDIVGFRNMQNNLMTYGDAGRFVPPQSQGEHDQLQKQIDELIDWNEANVETWQPEPPDGGWKLERKYIDDDEAYGCLVAIWTRNKRPDERRGYCGLAGKPEW